MQITAILFFFIVDLRPFCLCVQKEKKKNPFLQKRTVSTETVKKSAAFALKRKQFLQKPPVSAETQKVSAAISTETEKVSAGTDSFCRNGQFPLSFGWTVPLGGCSAGNADYRPVLGPLLGLSPSGIARPRSRTPSPSAWCPTGAAGHRPRLDLRGPALSDWVQYGL